MARKKKGVVNIDDIEPKCYYSRKAAAEVVDRDLSQINRWVNAGLLKQRFLRGMKRPVYLGSDLRRLIIERV